MTMHELSYFRPDYVVSVDDNEERCEDAHRVVRNAIAIAGVLHHLPGQQVIDAMTAVEHAEHPRESVYSMSPADATRIATVLDAVARALEVAVDGELRPRGGAAEDILAEAHLPSTVDGKPDLDRVFEVTADGRIGLLYPRISLSELRERLPEVASFLRRAGENAHTVVLDD
jgi:hypothetical protein